MYGLCDCNNFFASCERVFRPDLVGNPVVVLSNNDGCIIARSNEAKALGLGMGQPLFQARPLIERHGVTIFSANYSLYGDLSRRVMATLRTQVPALEVYSIDEAFFNLDGFAANTSAAATRPTGTSCRLSRRIDPRARREPTKREARRTIRSAGFLRLGVCLVSTTRRGTRSHAARCGRGYPCPRP